MTVAARLADEQILKMRERAKMESIARHWDLSGLRYIRETDHAYYFGNGTMKLEIPKALMIERMAE